MKAHLLHLDRDADFATALPAYAADVEKDLEVETVLDVMGGGDDFVRGVCERVLMRSLEQPEQIRYRQEVLSDCMQRPELLRALYAIAVEACTSPRRAHVFWFRDSPDALVYKSLRILTLLVESVKQLRAAADEHASAFRSKGFTTLFQTLQRELDDDYLATVEAHLRRLEFKHGVLISARLGRGNRGTEFVLRETPERSLIGRLTAHSGRAGYSFTVPARDESGAQALGDLRNRGIRLVANAVAQSTDHILGFFGMLRSELAFYVGCINLYEQLTEKGLPIAFPTVSDRDSYAFTARRLYDVALTFHLKSAVVENDVDADGAKLIVITGANQGGKSTFVRSVGLAQLMLQAGMFVGAESMNASVSTGVFTHFKREEDASMTSGKLDEELARMSDLADAINPAALLLCNESFASTNEREGAEIGRQVTHAMTEAGVRVVYVTHLFDLAESLYSERRPDSVFLRAERQADGSRTFRVSPGKPLPTSYGEDSYQRIFGSDLLVGDDDDGDRRRGDQLLR